MNKYPLFFLFLIFFASSSFSQQSLSDYSYILVPKQFEFQSESDKYQLNSLTKFLFNKYGFHAFFEEDLPENVEKCDGLIAEVEKSPAFVYTVLTVLIKDCNGRELYRSEKGKSKIKDFKKAYYEALRKAFTSIESLKVHQKEVNEDEISLVKQSKTEKEIIPLTTIDKSAVKNTNGELTNSRTTTILNKRYTSYRLLNNRYLLQKTKHGYFLYKESEDKITEGSLVLIGKITEEASRFKYLDTKKGTTTEAIFTTSNDLIIGEGNSALVYKIVK